MNKNIPSLSPALQNWYAKGSIKTINDHDVFVIDTEKHELPVLLLIHGFPTSSWDFQKVWHLLEKRFRLITLDMLGFGFSDKPNRRDYTIYKQTDLFTALLDDIGVQDFHILAHDYGDTVAQELLARHHQGSLNNNCFSCCFLNGGLFPETHHALFVQKLLLSPFGKYANALLGFSMFKKSFSKTFGLNTQPTNTDLHLFWELISHNDGRHIFHNLITYMNDRLEHRERWVNVLQNAQIPLALINGSVDPVSGAHLVTRYKELNCRLDFLQELPELGHYPHHEAPEPVVKAYLKFADAVS